MEYRRYMAGRQRWALGEAGPSWLGQSVARHGTCHVSRMLHASIIVCCTSAPGRDTACGCMREAG
jgi:hypothetical protein